VDPGADGDPGKDVDPDLPDDLADLLASDLEAAFPPDLLLGEGRGELLGAGTGDEPRVGGRPMGMGRGKAKDWDGSNVPGPCLVTADELDGTDTRMSVRVNGETWGEDSSANMHHSFTDLIAYASQGQTLYPGEVFGSGTAGGGSGMELDRWLREGDLVELEIEGIGVLRNRIGRKGG